MRKNILSVITCFFAVALLAHLISAEIMISQPKAAYNLGDDFESLVEVNEIQDYYLDIEMICSEINSTNENINLYHGILTEKAIQINRKLVPIHIGSLQGTCYLEARYGEFLQTSQNFEISDNIDVSLEINELNYKAGDSVIVNGKAIKDNNELVGKSLDSYVELKLGEESKALSIVKNGEFSTNFSVSEAISAGAHSLTVTVYDKDNEGNILNIGEARADLIINQEPAWIEIATDKETIIPGDSITIIPFLYDLARNQMAEQEIILRIEDRKGNTILEKTVLSGKEFIFNIDYAYPAGYSKIIAKKELIINEKAFDVGFYPKLSINLMNESVLIRNIGNALYEKSVEITIGDKTIVKNIKLSPEESIEYKLSAPSGDYEIVFKDEYGTIGQENVALTGEAISIKEIGNQFSLIASYPLAWIFLIAIVALTVFVLYKNNQKKNAYSFPASGIERIKKPENPNIVKESIVLEKKMIDKEEIGNSLNIRSNIIKPGTVKKAEHMLVLSGHKQDAAIIAIKIKNSMSKVAKENLNKAFENAYELKAVPCQIGETFLMIFTPLITKTLKNSELAIKTAQKIEAELKDHNRKFKERIFYGIGVHAGEIINVVEGDKLKFASIGTTINLAKRIADISNGDTLISKSAHEKTLREIKVDRAIEESRINKIELFKINRIMQENEKNKKFIESFLRRI